MLSSALVKAQIRSRSSQTIASVGSLTPSSNWNNLRMDSYGNFYFISGSGTSIYKYTASTSTSASFVTPESVVNWDVDSAGVVYFNNGGGSGDVYAIGGSYGASPVVIFTANWPVLSWAFSVRKDGTAICLTENSNGSSYNLVRYSAWSGGTATSNLISTGYGTRQGYTRSAYTDTFGNVYSASPSPSGPYSLVKSTASGTVTTLGASYVAAYGFAFDESSKYLYVPRSNVLYEVDSVSGSATGVTFSVPSLIGVATTPASRSIYVLSGGASASIIALAPNY